MNKRQLISMLESFNDEDEIKVVQKDGEESIKLVVIRKEEAIIMNEALGIEPDSVPVPDFVSLDEAHANTMLGSKNFPDIDNVSPPDDEDESAFDDDNSDEFRDEDDEENESFLREQGLIGYDSDNEQPY